ncbi:PCBP1, partial [Symbiodinium sp. CCMP2456]
MTRSIYVISPNGQQQCAGEYKQSQDSANGCPVWEQKGGGFWMYTGANGMWIIGGQDAKDKNFKCSHGFIFCRTQNAGVSPEKIAGVWERLSGEYFVEDRNIVVTNVLHKPSPLRVASPNGQQRCAGEYALMPDCTANGLPVWEHKAGRCYLYCGTNGSWILGGSDAKEKGFKCAKGVVYSKRASGGLMPDKVGGGWLRLHGDKFHEDSAITVTVKPSRLYVQTPHGQHRCSGEYVPAEDRLANGYPLWEHAGGKCWLYSGSNGMWIIGGTDAAAKNFECTRGVIYCQTVHNGQMPDKMVGNWLRLDGDKFREDAAILVGTKPPSLHILCPNGQPKCGGEYVLVGDRSHGQPTWKQRRTDLRICSGADGHWMVAAVRKDADSEKPLLRCDQPHLGETPDKVLSSWSRLEGEDMEKDDQIKVSSTSSLGKPVKLHVSTPSGQQSCGGEYLLVAGESANGSPLWKQMGGKYWLYSGTNGLWIIGGSGAKRKNFDCSRGVIYSQTPHGGQLPHQVSGIWLRLQGQEPGSGMSHIRSAEEEDFSGIIEIARQVVEEPDAFLFDEHCTTEELEAFWLPDLTMHAETFVLEASGFAGIIGAYVLYPAAHGRGAHMAHGSYMVAKHARGRGFGRALCLHSVAMARQQGYTGILINMVVSTNSSARGMCAACGFQTLCSIPRAFQHPELGLVDAFSMFYDLQQKAPNKVQPADTRRPTDPKESSRPVDSAPTADVLTLQVGNQAHFRPRLQTAGKLEVQPALPQGLALHPETGVITGTPVLAAEDTRYCIK